MATTIQQSTAPEPVSLKRLFCAFYSYNKDNFWRFFSLMPQFVAMVGLVPGALALIALLLQQWSSMAMTCFLVIALLAFLLASGLYFALLITRLATSTDQPFTPRLWTPVTPLVWKIFLYLLVYGIIFFLSMWPFTFVLMTSWSLVVSIPVVLATIILLDAYARVVLSAKVAYPQVGFPSLVRCAHHALKGVLGRVIVFNIVTLILIALVERGVAYLLEKVGSSLSGDDGVWLSLLMSGIDALLYGTVFLCFQVVITGTIYQALKTRIQEHMATSA